MTATLSTQLVSPPRSALRCAVKETLRVFAFNAERMLRQSDSTICAARSHGVLVVTARGLEALKLELMLRDAGVVIQRDDSPRRV